MIHYKFFSDFAAKQDTWMLSNPKTNEMWYDKLNGPSNYEYLLENVNQLKDGTSDTDCLVMSKNSMLDPELFLSIGDCTKKHSAICKVAPQRVNALTRPPKFPCMQSDHLRRRKRSLHEEKDQERPQNKGL